MMNGFVGCLVGNIEGVRAAVISGVVSRVVSSARLRRKTDEMDVDIQVTAIVRRRVPALMILES